MTFCNPEAGGLSKKIYGKKVRLGRAQAIAQFA
jgi:hypothetical protein